MNSVENTSCALLQNPEQKQRQEIPGQLSVKPEVWVSWQVLKLDGWPLPVLKSHLIGQRSEKEKHE